MRITVCELPDGRSQFHDAWADLCDHVASERSDLVLLPEMPFSRWLPETRDESEDAWAEAVADHDRWMDRLDDLAPATVAGSRPTLADGKRRNEGFVRTPESGARLVYEKSFLPEEPGFWEASWYGAGEREFPLVDCAGAACGFLVCTDLWAMEQARDYGRDGGHLLLNPRVTEQRTLEKWRAGARTASTVSGAFLASSNRVTVADDGDGTTFGGGGWLVDPDGTVLAETSRAQPFTTVDVDLAAAERAKDTYPRRAFDERAE